MLKVSVSMMKKLSQDRLASLPADTISMSPARNQGVKLELDAPSSDEDMDKIQLYSLNERLD